MSFKNAWKKIHIGEDEYEKITMSNKEVVIIKKGQSLKDASKEYLKNTLQSNKSDTSSIPERKKYSIGVSNVEGFVIQAVKQQR